MSAPKDKVLFVRADASLLMRLDKVAKNFARANPGMRTSRSDIVRWLLNEAILRHTPD